MKKVLKWSVIIIVIAALVEGGYYGYTTYYIPKVDAVNVTTLQAVKLGTGSVAQTINATGTVRSKQTVQITWQASGKVGKINVKPGDFVKANQVLATLDPGALPNNILSAQQNLVTDQQALTDLMTTQSTAPTDQQTVLNDQTGVANAQAARDLLNTARGTLAQIAAAQASYLLDQQIVNQKQAAYDSMPGDPNTNSAKALALTNLVAAQTNRASALVQFQWISGKPTAADIAAADNALALAKAQLVDAQSALSQVQNGPDTAQVASAKAKIAADQATIQLQTITAPFDGTVTEVSNMLGDTVTPGSAAFQIDDLSAFYSDLAVSETDISKIQVGQPVTFNFDATPNKTYHGIVTSVGQVGNTVSGVVDFTVTTQITDADASVKEGMTVSGNIIIASLNNVLMVPSQAIRTLGNRQVVYVLSNQPVSAVSTASAPTTGGAATSGTQRTRTAGTGGTTTSGTTSGTGGFSGTGGTGGTGSTGGTAGTGGNGSVSGTGTGGFGGNGATGGTGGFGGFTRIPLTPLPASNGGSIIPIAVQVGIASDTDTQITSSQLKAGDVIVLNMPTTTTATTASSGAGLLGTGIRIPGIGGGAGPRPGG